MSGANAFIKENAKWLIGIVFAAGIIYGEFKHVRTVETRLDKKIKIIVELKDEVQELQIKVAVLEQKKCE